jgi:putative transposase
VKRSLLVEGDGGPLATAVAGANVPDHRLLERTLDAVVLERPPVEVPEWPQHLCLDAGYDTDPSYLAALDRDYTPHIASHRVPPPPPERRFPARRWVVERTIAWLNRWRGILIRWEKKAENALGLLQLACALLWFRRLHRLTSAPSPRHRAT